MTVVGRTALFPNKIDQTTSGKAQLEYEHKQVHSGDAWMVTYNASTNDGAVLDRYIIVPNTTNWPHVFWDVIGQGLINISLYEGAAGAYNAVTAYNRNRNNARVNTTIIGVPSAAVVPGTLIWTWTSGTTGPGPARSSGATRETGELVLKRATTYLLRCTSGVNSNIISVDLTWYEQTNIEN
jgi:hypothetical protein